MMIPTHRPWLPLVLTLVATSASATVPCPAPPMQHCYGIKPGRGPASAVTVEDRFGTVTYTLGFPTRFCSAVAESGSAKPEGGLTGYTSRGPLIPSQSTVRLINRFGDFTLDVVRPSLLLVPSGLNPTGQPPAGPVLDAGHFQCWGVRRTAGTPPFRIVRDVSVLTQLGSETVDVSKPIRLCVPASLQGGAPTAATSRAPLLCFRTRTRNQLNGPSIFVENEFESDDGELIHRRDLCVPSVEVSESGTTTTLSCPESTTTTTTSTSTTTSTTTTTTSTSTTTTTTSTTTTTTTTTSTTTTSTTTTTTSTTTTTLPPPRCGDGVIDAGEQCDDGNTDAADCCSPLCAVDPDGTACSDGDVCNGAEACRAGRCEPPDTCRTSFLVAAVSNFTSNTVSLLDGASAAVTATIPVGLGPWGIALHPLGTEIWVTNRKSKTVSIIDVVTRAVTASIPVSRVPLGIVIDPTGSRAYVASYGTNVIEVIDTATRTRVARFRVDRGPAGLALDATGRTLWVASFGANTVQAIDPASGKLLARVRVGRKPLQVGIDDANGRVFVTNFASRSVTVVGMVSRSVLTTVPVGGKPFGVAVDPARGRVLVTNSGGAEVVVIDAAQNRVVGRLPVAPSPLGVGVDPAGRMIVTSASSGLLSVLDAAGGAPGSVTVGGNPVAFGQFVGTATTDCAGSAPRCVDLDPTVSGQCEPRAGCQFVARPGQDALTALVEALAAAVRALPATGLRNPAVTQALAAAVEQARQAVAAGGSAIRPELKAILRGARTLRRDPAARDGALRLLDLTRRATTLVRRTGR